MSMTWLKDYVDVDKDIKEFVEDITLSGSKVEGYTILGGDITNVVVGKICLLKSTQTPTNLLLLK